MKERKTSIALDDAMTTATNWLLTGDPAIRWQTMRDLTGAPATAIERERRKIANHGWGARLLELQNPEGRWAAGLSGDGGLYSPKWTSTTYTMLLLRDLGLPPNNKQTRKACKLLLDEGLQPDGGVNYGTWAKWQAKSETASTLLPTTFSPSRCPTADGTAAVRKEPLIPPSTPPLARWKVCATTNYFANEK